MIDPNTENDFVLLEERRRSLFKFALGSAIYIYICKIGEVSNEKLLNQKRGLEKRCKKIQ